MYLRDSTHAAKLFAAEIVTNAHSAAGTMFGDAVEREDFAMHLADIAPSTSAMSIFKTYVCFTTELTPVCRVDSSAGSYPLPLRLDLRSISPSGFSWADGGPGQQQLSLAIVADHFSGSQKGEAFFAGDALAMIMAEYFNYVFLAAQPARGFTISTDKLQHIFHAVMLGHRSTILEAIRRAFAMCVRGSLFDFHTKPTIPLRPFHQLRDAFAVALANGLGLSEEMGKQILAEANVNTSYENFGG